MIDEQTEFERRQAKLEEYQNSEEYNKKLNVRAMIHAQCAKSAEARAYAYAACKNDPVFFINNFCWTPNDKYKLYHFPFILFPFQEDYIHWLNEHIDSGKDGLVEKSREMGVTWLTTTLFLWKWLFNDNFNALIGSYKETLVDDKTKDSLFGMLDYNVQRLPKWMMPKRFNFKQHRTAMKIVNPESNNVIKGDTMNPKFGRGSRRTVIFLDEGAHWEYFEDAWEGCGDTTNSRITVSTPLGYNAFAEKRNSGIDVYTLHWKSHPLKDEQWYQYEKSRRTDEAVAQELDISYNRSQKGRYYPEWDNVQFGEFPYDPSLPIYCSWDFGRTDDTALIWAQKDRDGNITILDCYWNNGKTIDFYVPFVTGILPSDGYNYTKRDMEVIDAHRHWSRGTHFGDPAGRFQNQVTNLTVFDVLKQSGIHVNFQDRWKEHNTRQTQAKLLMRDRLRVNDNARTRYLNVCIVNSQYAEITRGGMTVVNSLGMKPRHDQYSHLRSAIEYLALGLEMGGQRSKVFDKFKKRDVRQTVNY